MTFRFDTTPKVKTTNNFKVGDKVYVVQGDFPGDPDGLYIRAIITEIDNTGWGYQLRAFRQDLPGIYMYNVWDVDLIPRKNGKMYKNRDE